MQFMVVLLTIRVLFKILYKAGVRNGKLSVLFDVNNTIYSHFK